MRSSNGVSRKRQAVVRHRASSHFRSGKNRESDARLPMDSRPGQGKRRASTTPGTTPAFPAKLLAMVGDVWPSISPLMNPRSNLKRICGYSAASACVFTSRRSQATDPNRSCDLAHTVPTPSNITSHLPHPSATVATPKNMASTNTTLNGWTPQSTSQDKVLIVQSAVYRL